jgi:hypothetical protein
VILYKAFALQYKVYTRASEPRTLFQQILHPIKDLMILSRLFLVTNGGAICAHYPAGPTLAHAEGFLQKLNGFALFVRP